MKRPGRASRWLTLLVVGAMSACVVEDPPLPSLDQLRGTETADVPIGSGLTMTAEAWRIELALDAATHEAWALTGTVGLPEPILERWHRNGLQIGHLDTEAWPDFEAQLPPIQNTRRANIFASSKHPHPLYTSPPLTKPIRVESTDPDESGQRDDSILIQRGQCQLLLETNDGAAGKINTLTPYHHRPRLIVPLPKLNPNDHITQTGILHGTIFHRLAMPTAAARDRLLVVGLYRPPAEPAESQTEDGEPEDPATTNESPTNAGEPDQHEPQSTPPEPLPYHLGRQLFTARRLGRPIQILLLIRIPQDADRMNGD